jgi:hypothetical protein
MENIILDINNCGLLILLLRFMVADVTCLYKYKYMVADVATITTVADAVNWYSQCLRFGY